MPTYRALLSLGFWKKLVYATKADTSLDLCLKFCNMEHFKIIKENFIESDALTAAQQQSIEKMEQQLLIRYYFSTRNTLENQAQLQIEN